MLGAEGLYGGFITPSDWGEDVNSLLERLNLLREEPTSLWKVLDSLGILSLVVPLDSQGKGGLQGQALPGELPLDHQGTRSASSPPLSCWAR